MTSRGAALALPAALSLALAAAAAEPPPAPEFERDIAPILREHCASCHGADKQENLLRLDSRSEALKGGMSGPVIVPGRSGESLLVQHLTGQAKPRMPHEKPPLAPELIATLAAWIDAGAAGPDAAAATQSKAAGHWGFVAPVRPAVPAAPRRSNPIDAFVRQRLAHEGLAPSARADKVTLLRRASLDLVGLPPSLAEIDAFLKDASPGAWERQVDRLLASPHYGERWARFWLDAARYADSDGFEKDKPRSVWVYRDWVVGALNRDLPYDRFVIEQIAGDLLPGATEDQVAATGYLRNSMINEEGGIDPEQFRMEAMFDRMDAIGKGVLGLTIQCAQCHNHKFDPITQEEYYRLLAFLNDSHEGSRAFYTPDEQRRRAEILRGTREIEAELQHTTPDWAERLATWEESVRGREPEWTVVRPIVEDISTGGARYLPQPDGSLLQLGYAPTKHRVKLSAKVEANGITAFRIELLNDPNLPLGGPGRSLDGTGALTEFEVEIEPVGAAPDAKPVPVKLASATADVNPRETVLAPIFDDKSNRRRVTGPVAFAIDGKEETAWGIDVGPGRRNVARKAVFVADSPVGFASGTWLHVYLKQNHGGWNSDDNQNNNLGRMRLSYTTAPSPVADPLPARVRAALSVPLERRSPFEAQAVLLVLAHDAAGVEGSQRADRGALGDLSRRRLPAGARGPRREAHDEHPDARRLPATHARGRAGRAGAAAPAAGNERAADAARLRALARRPPFPDGRTLDREPRVASAFRHGARGDTRGLRPPGRAPHASRAPRLARRRAHGRRLEPEATAPADPQLRDVRPVLERDAGPAGEGSLQSAARARAARARGRRGGAGHRTRGERAPEPEARRPERLSTRSGLPLRATRELRPEAVARGEGRRPRPLPAGALYLPLPLAPLPGAPGLRRSGGRLRVRAARAHQHAAAGAHDTQRARLPGGGARAGAERARGREPRRAPRPLRLPPRAGARADAGRSRRAAEAGAERAADASRTASSTPGTWRRTTRTSPWRCRRASRWRSSRPGPLRRARS